MFLVFACSASRASVPMIGVDELKPGMEGTVLTVFKGTVPEPFTVKVTGVLRNALGPGKSMIICELTDPRVQPMGATAGMSGSPLYIGGRLAGALSYQIQTMETVRHAGFTPAADMLEVGSLVPLSGGASQSGGAQGQGAANSGAGPLLLRPVLAAGGLSQETLRQVGDDFRALGLEVGALSGTTQAGVVASAPAGLQPGSPVGVALVTGDITLAATGTVTMVDGERIVAFGHPLMGLGEVDLPLCAAEVLTILPSSLSSVKLSNVGPVIGTLRQDRLSAVSGLLGAGPQMIEVVVRVSGGALGPTDLHYKSVRHPTISPMALLLGCLQAVNSSNSQGHSEGYRVRAECVYPGEKPLLIDVLQNGSGPLQNSLREIALPIFIQLQNPFARVYPERVSISVDRLSVNPTVMLESARVGGGQLVAGDKLELELGWQEFQGARRAQTLQLPLRSEWSGRKLELVLVPGPVLDQLTGESRPINFGQHRTLSSLLDALRRHRRSDGLYAALIERADGQTDGAAVVLDQPASMERITRRADEARFQSGEVFRVLQEIHVMPGSLCTAVYRKPIFFSE